MSEWLTGTQLLFRWKINGVRLLDFIKKGLPPYNELGHQQPPPDVAASISLKKKLESELEKSKIPETVQVYIEDETDEMGNMRVREQEIVPRIALSGYYDEIDAKVNELNAELDRIDIYSWAEYGLPEADDEALQVIEGLKSSLFDSDDVEAFEEKNNLRVKTAEPEKIDLSPMGHKPSYENAFMANGSYWEVYYQGVKKSLQDTRGLRFIILLVENADTPIHVFDLEHLVPKRGGGTSFPPDKSDLPMDDTDFESMDDDGLEWFEQDREAEPVSEKLYSLDTLSNDEHEELKKVLVQALKNLENANSSGNVTLIAQRRQEYEDLKRHLWGTYRFKVNERNGRLSYTGQKYLPEDKELHNARNNIRNQVKDQIARMKAGPNPLFPELGDYLERHFQYGREMRFSDTTTEWLIDRGQS